MKALKVIILLFLINSFVTEILKGQIKEYLVSVDKEAKPLIDVFNELEKKYPINFYYKRSWIDSIKVSREYNDYPLEEFLSKLLIKNNLYYTNDSNRSYFITTKKINLQVINIVPDDYIETADKKFVNEESNPSTSQFFERITIGKKNNLKENAIISGFIKDTETGEPLFGVNVYVEELRSGTATNSNGHYMLNLKKGTYNISFRQVGKETVSKLVTLNSDGHLNINLQESLIALDEVIVKEDKYNNTKGLQAGLEQITMKDIKELPPIAGERDILKASLLLPGVQTVGESAAGYNIRGGAADQNLFLINNVPIYNTSHMFGFFSTFNPEVIRNFNLYKSSIPIEYGGRISSVFDIQTKNGNSKKFSLKGGLSPVTAKLSAEGPIIRDKSSYIIGARSTYSSWILKKVKNPELRNSDVFFHDIVFNLNNAINQNNNLGVFAYYSLDNFKFPTNSTYTYSNLGGSINWQHSFRNNLYSKLSLIYSNYSLEVVNEEPQSMANQFNHDIKHFELNQKFNFNIGLKHKLKFGFSTILYRINPGNYKPLHSESDFTELNIEEESALESAIFIGDRFDISPKFGIEAGLRYSSFLFLGPSTVLNYQDNVMPSAATLIDTSYYTSFQLVKQYSALDIRISGRYLLNANHSIKFGYNRITQYLFLLTNTISISPTDRWKLSDAYIPPTLGEQYNLGFYKNFGKKNLEASIEFYYKTSNNLKELKNGVDVDKNQFIERDLLTGKGLNYGIELMIKKPFGRINGWINYTYSKSTLKFEGATLNETINGGNYYPSNTDKPHNINFVFNVKANRQLSLSTNFTYSTGRPTTFPVSKSFIGSVPVTNYSDRNASRLPDYWRIDLAFNFEGNLLRKKIAHSYWTFAVYNITGRKNAYSVYFTNENGIIKGHKISIFANPVVTLTYNFKLGNYSSN